MIIYGSSFITNQIITHLDVNYIEVQAGVRYYLRRDLTSKYVYLFTDYYTVSLSLSYRLIGTK